MIKASSEKKHSEMSEECYVSEEGGMSEEARTELREWQQSGKVKSTCNNQQLKRDVRLMRVSRVKPAKTMIKVRAERSDRRRQ